MREVPIWLNVGLLLPAAVVGAMAVRGMGRMAALLDHSDVWGPRMAQQVTRPATRWMGAFLVVIAINIAVLGDVSGGLAPGLMGALMLRWPRAVTGSVLPPESWDHREPIGPQPDLRIPLGPHPDPAPHLRSPAAVERFLDPRPDHLRPDAVERWLDGEDPGTE